MKKFEKRVAVYLLCFFLIISAMTWGRVTILAAKSATSGILGNGTSNIYIDINAAPYSTFQGYEYGQYAMTTSGCAWFASARVNQLTGKGNVIRAGTNWYNNATSLGYSRGVDLSSSSKAIACWSNHVAIVECVNGSTVTVSEGGTTQSDEKHGYCIIRNTTSSYFANNGNGNFLGFVYINVPFASQNPQGEMTVPTITTDSIYYSLGLTMKMTWKKTSSSTDFLHYWVIIYNVTTGKEVFGGASGSDGDVNANSLNYKFDKAGVYDIAVYAIPYNNKEQRQKLAKATVVAGAVGNMTTPTITTDAEYYHAGSTMKMSWSKTSANSDFYQYWVVVHNITTDEGVYGGASGEARNVECNHLDIKLPKAGKYRVRVYAVPFTDKDARQKVYTKYVNVETSHIGGIATCKEKAKCSICGKEYGSLATHTYDTKWSSDGTNHWHECTVCGDKKDCAVHTLKTTTTKATLTANGKKETKCSKCGKVTKTETIYAAKTIKLSATKYTYDGKAKKPTVTIKDSKGNVIASTNYTITYSSGRKNVGKYTVKVTFKGNYSGSKNLTFTINPPKTSVSKVTAEKQAFTLKWAKKTTQVTGYEIQYSTSKTFASGNKTVKVTSAKTASKTIKSLKAKKTYYVRIRTYKTVSKVNYYSDWSAKKSVTTKE